MQIANGVRLEAPIPKVVDSYSGSLIILGGAKCLWDDYLKVKTLLTRYNIMCINDIGCQFKAEPIHHAVSLHRRILPSVRYMRQEKSMPEHVVTHCHRPFEGVQVVWTLEQVGGTSGLFATQIALALGYTRIILCGIPIDGTGHYWDPENVNDNKSTKFDDKPSLNVWSQMIEKNEFFGQRVRSMSGRTKNLLGYPTPEWLSC